MSRKITYLLYLLLGINFFYVVSGAIFLPMESVDVVGIWLFKAKAFFVEGGLPLQTLTNPDFLLFHPQYPLLLPAVYSLIYFALGQVWELPILLLYPLYYLAILLVALKVFHKMGLSEMLSLFFVYMYSMFSPLLGQAGRGHAGSADIVIVLCSWIVVWLMQNSDKNKQYHWWLLVIIMIASQIKLEGLFLAASLLTVKMEWPKKCALLFLAVFPTLLWMGVIKWLELPSDFTFVIPSFGEFTYRLWLVGIEAIKEMVNVRNWYLFWPLFWVVILLFPQKIDGFMAKLIGISLLMNCAFVGVYLLVTTDISAHISSSIDRVLFQISPFIYPIFVYFSHKLLHNEPRISSWLKRV